MSKEFNLGILTGFILIVTIFTLLIWMPPAPRPISQIECDARFVAWCYQCLSSNWSDDIVLPSKIECMRYYNPLNIPLPQTKTCSSMQYLCNYFDVR